MSKEKVFNIYDFRGVGAGVLSDCITMADPDIYHRCCTVEEIGNDVSRITYWGPMKDLKTVYNALLTLLPCEGFSERYVESVFRGTFTDSSKACESVREPLFKNPPRASSGPTIRITGSFQRVRKKSGKTCGIERSPPETVDFSISGYKDYSLFINRIGYFLDSGESDKPNKIDFTGTIGIYDPEKDEVTHSVTFKPRAMKLHKFKKGLDGIITEMKDKMPKK